MQRSPHTFELVFVWGGIAAVFAFIVLAMLINRFDRRAKFNAIMQAATKGNSTRTDRP
jgi:hypothetical protein